MNLVTNAITKHKQTMADGEITATSKRVTWGKGYKQDKGGDNNGNR